MIPCCSWPSIPTGNEKYAALLKCFTLKGRATICISNEQKAMARSLNEKHPEWCLRTCESRIDVWLNVAESMLYRPMCDAFGTNSDRFYLKGCAESA